VQAENPQQSAWAVACRTEAADATDLGGLLDSGAVLRTHVLRPTWHYVRAEDIVWLIEVTAPRVLNVTAQQLTDLDDQALDRATAAVLDSLAGEGDLTRTQLAEALAARGVAADRHLLMILLAHLELQTLICSGRPAAGQHTYALMSARVPEPRRLGREEGLAELALRYFTGHGPATEKDLAYWATLTVTDVRTGLAAVRGELESFEHDGRVYWHAPGDPPPPGQEPRGHLLQILDEIYRGYQDSRYVLDVAGLVPRAREAATGMALVDGQMVAWMKRTLAKDRVDFGLTPLRDLAEDEIEALQQAADRYGEFLSLEPRLVMTAGPGSS
jgi:Winged helix DNA-binding domain